MKYGIIAMVMAVVFNMIYYQQQDKQHPEAVAQQKLEAHYPIPF